jgi:putative nucleotidyltransferase with HDIG domain
VHSVPNDITIATLVLGCLSLILVWVRLRPKTAVPAANDSPEPASVGIETTPLATPLGARLRPSTQGYSVGFGIFEQVERGLCELPPFPPATAEIMRELDDVMSDAHSVASAICREPTLATTLLRIANSVVFAMQREIVTVADAVAYMGLSTTKALFLRLKIGNLFPQAPVENGYDGKSLWCHSVAVSQAADELARRVGGIDPNLAATAGLLHDIGKLAINSRFPATVRKLWSEELAEQSFLYRESRLFGADHAVIGSRVARQWKLPEQLAQMIRLHHLPADQPLDLTAEARGALYVVFVANQLVKYCHVYCEQMEIDPIPSAVALELGLPAEPQKLLDERMRRKIMLAISVSNQVMGAG